MTRAVEQGQVVDGGRGLDAWKRTDPLQGRIVKGGPLRRCLISRRDERHLHRQDIAEVEARVALAQREQALDHDARAHQQYQRQRHFADDQEAPRADPDGGIAPATFLQGVVDIGSAGANSR